MLHGRGAREREEGSGEGQSVSRIGFNGCIRFRQPEPSINMLVASAFGILCKQAIRKLQLKLSVL